MNWLSWQEALEAMSKGCKVKHVHFTDDEYFLMKNKVICDENGYDMTRWYKGESWQNEHWYIA
ncbi:hypothetical protein CPT_pKp20_062 [Klebsiella phage pKp20]|nr:hypothetical protein CPT_pKp20_062 [Klebsiella phage pKp20]